MRSGPLVVADEIGYLTNARVLVGGLPGQLELAPYYRGGYSLLLAPLIELGSSQVATYHLLLVLNAVLAASVFPLLYVLLTRHLEVRRDVAIWAAFAGAVYPAVTVLSQAALSENALFPLVVVWLLAAGGLFGEHRDRARAVLWGAGLGLSTVALLAVHGRMVVAVGVAVLLLAYGLWRGVDKGALLTALAVVGVGVFAVHLLNDHLLAESYGEVARAEGDLRLEELFRAHGLLAAAANLVGQAWYLLVATLGLVVFVFADVRSRWARSGCRELPVAELALVALTVGLLIISAAAFPQRTRPDMLIYGRYVEIVSPVLVALGLAVLARRGAARFSGSWLPWGAGLVVATALVVISVDDPGDPSRWNISALPFVSSSIGAGTIVAASLAALAGAWALNRVASRGLLLGCLATALFAAVSLYGTWDPVFKAERGAYPAGWESPEGVADRERIAVVSYDLDDYDALGLYGTQWFMSATEFRLFHGRRASPPTRFVLGGSSWPRDHERLARELWRWEGADEVLWELRR